MTEDIQQPNGDFLKTPRVKFEGNYPGPLYAPHPDLKLERKQRSDTVLSRYNAFYNEECSGLPHGTPVTPEHMQALALECMVDALLCENMNVEYDSISIEDIKDLAERLYQQGDEFLKRVQEFEDSADGVV